MLMNMKSNSKVGKAITETASIAYDGTLLPTGTASYAGISIDPTKRYLKNSGKDKTPALVESGQGKFFNGTSQYINTGIIPNQAEGTLVTRFTYSGSSARCIAGFKNAPDNGLWLGTSGGYMGLSYGSIAYTANLSNILLVIGQSYHVAVTWNGTAYKMYINNILTLSGNATAPSGMLALFVGARNNNGTQDIYYNSVIDETYYYNVALPNTAIQSLYLYPEKVKSYNGAIVPDIGYEANCKLFLPMCENSGSNVVNVAVASVDGSYTTVFSSIDVVVNTISYIDKTFTINQVVATSAGYKPYFSFLQTVGVLYEFEAIIKVISGTTKLYQWETGNIDGSNGSAISYNTVLTAGQTLVVSRIGYVRANGSSNLLFDGLNYPTANFTVEFKIRTVTAYPLASYTTAMHTSATKLSYGAQCTAWKRDSLGVLLGMSNGLSFDGGVSVKSVTTEYAPALTDSFAVAITLAKNNAIQRDIGAIGTVLFRKSATNTVVPYVFSQTATASAVQTEDYARYAISYNGTTKLFTFYKNGVLVSTSLVVASVAGSAISFGQTDLGVEAYYRIYNPSQIAKFDPVKDYQASLKYAAKLGA